MKKIALACVFALLCSSAHAIDVKLTLSGEIELGSDIASYNAFADVNAAFNLYFWKCKNSLYGGSTTWIRMDWYKPSAYPFREIYYYGNRFSLYGFFIDVKHFCNHPVKSNELHSTRIVINGRDYYTMNEKWYSNFWGETLTTISVGYEFEFDIWHN
jgi:hypothetical protein